jgi:ribonuclease BN (tRNA processing enzyme)
VLVGFAADHGERGADRAREKLTAKGADLFICEATFFEREDPSHISYRQVMAHRDEFEAKRIVLTHLGAETLAHLSEVELKTSADGMLIEI